jgi:hypothetical protein
MFVHPPASISRAGPFPVHVTLRPYPWSPFLFVVLFVPSPYFRVARYSPLMSDVVLVCPHALLSIQVTPQDHAGHLDVAEDLLATTLHKYPAGDC